MEETKFFKSLKRNWMNDDLRIVNPIDRRMLDLKDIEGMNTENVRFLINEIVKIHAKEGVYLEVGCYRGASLCSAAYQNPSTQCLGIDNFSVWDKDGTNKDILEKNIKPFSNIKFIEDDYKNCLSGLEPKSIDVYFYDGEHSLGAQYEGLFNMLPYLKDKCLIIVDDTNWQRVDYANQAFIQQHPEFKMLLDIKTPGNGHAGWWNGIQVIGRNIE